MLVLPGGLEKVVCQSEKRECVSVCGELQAGLTNVRVTVEQVRVPRICAVVLGGQRSCARYSKDPQWFVCL